jgi:hypothetical protein
MRTIRAGVRVSASTVLAHVILYGLIAGASALAITSVIVVLRTDRGRVNGLLFAVGFLVAQAVVCALALLIGTESVPQRGDSHHVFVAVLEILVAIGIFAAAWRLTHPRPPRDPPRRLDAEIAARRTAALERLGSLRPGAVLGTGAALGVGGPKRLTLTLVAAATIAAGSLSAASEVSLVAVYVAIATALVWVPVMLTLVFGRRAAEWTAAGERWWAGHRTKAMFVPLVVLAVYFLVLGITTFAST